MSLLLLQKYFLGVATEQVLRVQNSLSADSNLGHQGRGENERVNHRAKHQYEGDGLLQTKQEKNTLKNEKE